MPRVEGDRFEIYPPFNVCVGYASMWKYPIGLTPYTGKK
jgi:hypothetical protein